MVRYKVDTPLFTLSFASSASHIFQVNISVATKRQATSEPYRLKMEAQIKKMRTLMDLFFYPDHHDLDKEVL